MKNARLVNVILVEDGPNQTYYTVQDIPKTKKRGGVVARPSAKEVKAQKEKDVEKQIENLHPTEV